LLQAVQVLERGGEALEAALLQERAQAELDPRAVAQRFVPRAALCAAAFATRYFLVFGAELVDRASLTPLTCFTRSPTP
jgi:hypothetical protein